MSWRADPIARRYQPLQHQTTDQLRARLTDQGSHQLCPTATADFLWVVESSAGPVGWVSLKKINREPGTAAIGYTIASDAHRRGYATAAVSLLIDLAFSPAGADLARLEAVAATENVASRRVLERTGFTFEGIARGYLVIDGKRVDHARYGLPRDDVAQDPVVPRSTRDSAGEASWQ